MVDPAFAEAQLGLIKDITLLPEDVAAPSGRVVKAFRMKPKGSGGKAFLEWLAKEREAGNAIVSLQDRVFATRDLSLAAEVMPADCSFFAEGGRVFFEPSKGWGGPGDDPAQGSDSTMLYLSVGAALLFGLFIMRRSK